MALPMERQERIVALLEECDALLTQQISDQLNISLRCNRNRWRASRAWSQECVEGFINNCKSF
jgi:hypothetical protein